jgi:hypothetical protein
MGTLNTPLQLLLSALSTIQADEMMGKSVLDPYLSILESVPTFRRSKAGPDILFAAAYDYENGRSCKYCSPGNQLLRPPRDKEEETIVYYGTIALGN